MSDPIITKEYVEGGINVTTTTVEFIPAEVLDSRLKDAQAQIADLQDTVVEILGDKDNIPPSLDGVDDGG